jgi:hypothetical protein
MHNIDMHRCRVCGLYLDDPPWGSDGHTPLYDFCPCCGVEFGYQDATPAGARKFRDAWLAGGANWDQSERRPEHWDAKDQLAHVPEGFR